jgi:hypothetical protein
MKKTETKFPIDSIDLCAREVRVSREGLQRLAQIAVFRSRNECERALHTVQTAQACPGASHETKSRAGISAYMAADNLANAAKDLALSLRFLHAFDSLADGERETLEIHPQRGAPIA